jgi:hypothetical protein
MDNEETNEIMCECGNGVAKTFNTLTGGRYCDECIEFLEEEGLH